MATLKRIRVPHNGVILAKGGISGPITNPYLEDVLDIQRMLLDNIPVIEVLDSGKEVTLTLRNFNKDNSGAKVEKEPEQAKAPEATAPTAKTETVTPPAQTQNQGGNNNQKNQQRNQNQGADVTTK